MRAIVVQAGTPDYLALQDVPEPPTGGDAIVVRVKAFSLNRGEVKRSATRAVQGARPGTDFAGVVESAPAGSGFAVGDRVAGMARGGGGWSERVAVPARAIARMPGGVSFELAAALPVAGLTAAIALGKKELAPGSRVLVSGATGGVGMIAIQLATARGAHVTALSRNPVHAQTLMRLGAKEVLSRLDEVAASSPHDLVLDLVGGDFLGQALGRLASRGVCVLAGNAGGAVTTFNGDAFRMEGGVPYAGVGVPFGGTMLYGFFLGEEILHVAPGPLLADLLVEVDQGRLDPMLGRVRPWTETLQVANALLAREFPGKAVLTVDGA